MSSGCFLARDLPSIVGWKARREHVRRPYEASIDLANPDPDANVGMPLTVRITLGVPNRSIALSQCPLKRTGNKRQICRRQVLDDGIFDAVQIRSTLVSSNPGFGLL